jgi:nucleotide-binding universal stress UspA family protein
LVFHVREWGPLPAVALQVAGPLELESQKEAMEFVDHVVRGLKDAGISARGEIVDGLTGQAPKEILQIARSFDADVVVMGSRGRSDLAGLVLGSVTHKVLHLTDRPVLVVR